MVAWRVRWIGLAGWMGCSAPSDEPVEAPSVAVSPPSVAASPPSVAASPSSPSPPKEVAEGRVALAPISLPIAAHAVAASADRWRRGDGASVEAFSVVELRPEALQFHGDKLAGGDWWRLAAVDPAPLPELQTAIRRDRASQVLVAADDRLPTGAVSAAIDAIWLGGASGVDLLVGGSPSPVTMPDSGAVGVVVNFDGQFRSSSALQAARLRDPSTPAVLVTPVAMPFATAATAIDAFAAESTRVTLDRGVNVAREPMLTTKLGVGHVAPVSLPATIPAAPKELMTATGDVWVWPTQPRSSAWKAASGEDAATSVGAPLGGRLATSVSMDLADRGEWTSAQRESLVGTFRMNRSQLRYCQEVATRASGGPVKGRIELGWTLRGGAVGDVRVLADTAGNAELASCLARRVGNWRFAAPLSGAVRAEVVLANSAR